MLINRLMLLRSFYFSVNGRVTETSMVVSRGLKPLAHGASRILKPVALNWPDTFKTCIKPVPMSSPVTDYDMTDSERQNYIKLRSKLKEQK